jgi:hypothetical protein
MTLENGNPGALAGATGAEIKARQLSSIAYTATPDQAWEPQHIVCKTLPGCSHAYWLLDDYPLHAFRPVQKDLVETLGGDYCIHDLPRVVRLPGFWHLKSDPCMVWMMETVAFPATFSSSEFQIKINAVKPAPTLSERAMPKGAPQISVGNGWADTAMRGEMSNLLAAPEEKRSRPTLCFS